MTCDQSLASLFVPKFNMFIDESFKYRLKKFVVSSISAYCKTPTLAELGVVPESLFSSILVSLEFVVINFVTMNLI